MLFNTFTFATRRFGIGHKAWLDPHRTMHGVAIGMRIRGSIKKEYIFQMCNGGQQRKQWKKPYNPNSPGQQTLRSKFADAVAWAKGLSEAEKDAYKVKVSKPWLLRGYPHSSFSGRSWLNWAISDYLVSH